MGGGKVGRGRRFITGLVVFLAAVVLSPPAWAAKNIIIMVSDGAGYNTWIATSIYQGKLGKQVYDGPYWTRLASTTYPLSVADKPGGTNEQNPKLVYDPAKFWNSTPVTLKASKTPTFAGYVFGKTTATDSASAATALAAGRKTYNAAINWTDDDKPLSGQTIPEIAKARGKSCGVITTVQWSHATPAGLGGAHNVKRDNYAAIAKEMLAAPWLDVIMGAGHPEFDDDGAARSDPKKQEFKYVGGRRTWETLKAGTHPAGWILVESKTAFEKLTHGPTPRKVLGTAQVATTLQQKRLAPAKKTEDEEQPAVRPHVELPFEKPLNKNVPTLETMTKAAINCLDDNPKGFYLMIEGGAVDWANHANQPGRMIEEQIDFLRAVEAVAAWVQSHSNWDETLLILTADHESGGLWGKDSGKKAYEPLEDRGPGKLPGLKYNGQSHSSALVPLLACGAGSQRFADLVRGTDKTAAAVWKISGQYVDNTDVFTVMKAEVTADGGE